MHQNSFPLDFAWLIHPLNPDDFFENIFEKKCLHLRREDVNYFAHLKVKQNFNQILFSCDNEWGPVSLAKADVSPDNCKYLQNKPDLLNLNAAFNDGFTIVVNNIQNRYLPCAQLCRTIEQSFFCRANINAYYTNKNTQGLAAHYDDDDVIILQLEGAKKWKVFDTEIRLPLREQSYALPKIDQTDSSNYYLNEGDLLYLPRGVVHQVTSEDEVSLHLTISINSLRYLDLIQECLKIVAETDKRLRRSLCLDTVKLDRGGELQDCFEGVHLERLRKALPEAVINLQNKLIDGTSIVPSKKSIEETFVDETLCVDEELRVSPGQIFCLERGKNTICIKGVGLKFEFPVEMSDFVDRICINSKFTVRDISKGMQIDFVKKIVQTLLDKEFLVKVR